MSEGIVDVFEAVQIQKEYGDFFQMPRSQSDRLVYTVVQEHAIGQAGQKVVLGRMGHLLGHGASSAHVAKDDDGPRSFPLMVMDGSDGIFDRRFRSITPYEDTVRWQMHGFVQFHCRVH